MSQKPVYFRALRENKPSYFESSRNKPSYILGISESHTASAAILKDGAVIAAASEERFTRRKQQPGLPKNAIKFCLDFAKIKPTDLTMIACADLTPPIFDNQIPKKTLLYYPQELLLETQERAERLFPNFRKIIYNSYKAISQLRIPARQKLRTKKLSKYLAQNEDKFIFYPHHVCHAAAALFASPFASQKKPALIFTADGVGDFESATVFQYSSSTLKKLVSIDSQQSLGFFYQHITQYLGLKPNRDEHKVMGLAPYVSDKKSKEVYKILAPYFRLERSKSRFTIKISEYHLARKLPQILKYRRFDHIAAATQQILEEIITQWVASAIRNYKIDTIVCGGGVFNNVKLNQKIAQLKEVKNAFFMPSPGDETNAIGAAYYSHFRKTQTAPKPLTHLYLGPSYTTTDIKKTLSNLKGKFKIKKPKDINSTVAKLLAEGVVVARFFGRMEFGARALGNRSILASPNNPKVVQFINFAIKNRDFWMPFAPTILREHSQDYLILHKADSPFMNTAYKTTPKGKVDLTAAIHPYDKTTRPQILDRHINPSYYDLAKKFERTTGIGAVLNTSFNLHGEPIVCSPQDALLTFKKSGLKYLIIENWLIEKR